MRATIIMALAAVAGCSSGSEEKTTEPVAASMEPGLWEVTHEVTNLTATDQAPAMAVKAKAGDREVVQVCVAEENRAEPQPALFAGKDRECSYRDSYFRNGRLNATLTCTFAGVRGEVMMSVDGDYKATEFDANLSATSYLPGDGDFRMTSKLSGRHTGPCPAEMSENAVTPSKKEG